jgi:hypothetical protein
MRRFITLMLLLFALVLAIGPPGWATVPSAIIKLDKASLEPATAVIDLNLPNNPFNGQIVATSQSTTAAIKEEIAATVLEPISNTPDQTAYEKPGLSITELLYFCGDEYTVYCLANELNFNGDKMLEGRSPLKYPIDISLNHDFSFLKNSTDDFDLNRIN